MNERWVVHFSGRVQGVGFRYTATALAATRPVTGYVMNLADGRVVVEAEGDARAVEDFVEAIQDRMSGYIRESHIERLPASGVDKEFRVRYE